MLALFVIVMLWTVPPPQFYVCAPGHGPTAAASSCERLSYKSLGTIRINSTRLRLLLLTAPTGVVAFRTMQMVPASSPLCAAPIVKRSPGRLTR